jgi:hypothetical protein
MATDKKYSISIGNLKDTIKDVESFGDALENSGGKLDELGKITKKIEEYDKEYQKSLQQSKNALKEKNDAIKEEIDLEKANQTIQENSRKSYNEKQKLMNALSKEIKTMNTETDDQKKKQEELIKQYADLNQELKDFDKEMGNSQRNVGDYSLALKDAKQELKDLKGQMMGLDQHSKEFEQLAQEAGKTADKIGDINAAIKRAASDTQTLDSIIDVAKSATAAFELYKGTMSAFGIETENAEAAMQKLLGAMSIIQSLQTLSDTLQSTSATAQLLQKALKLTGAEMVISQANAIKATVAQEGLSKSQKAGAIASKTFGLALKAIPLFLIIGLITELVLHWEDLLGWLNKTFPSLNNVGGAMNALVGVVRGLGTAVINFLINPWKTFAEVIQKILAKDFGGAVQAALNGVNRQFTDFGKDFMDGWNAQVNKGLQEQANKTLETTNQETQYQLKMLQAKLGNDAKYSKAGIALQKKDFAERKKLAKGNKDELKNIALEEANFYRECQEKKAAAAKKSADDRKKAEKAASDEAKRLAAEQKKKDEEEKKKAEEARKKEEERIRNLNSARKEGADLEIEYQKAILDERKRVAEESIKAQDKEIKSVNDEIKALQKIVDNDRLSKKTRMAAAEQLEKATAKLMRVEEERKNLLDKELELEKEIIRLNREKEELSVFEDLKQNLSALTMTKEEFTSLINGTSDKLKDFDDIQVQHVKNAAKQMEIIAQKAATSIEKITTSTNEKKESGSNSSGGTSSSGEGKDKKKSWEDLDLGEKIGLLTDAVIAPAMDTFSMFMDFAIEETAQKLEEVEELHDKALEKVESSADKIKELNEKLKDSSLDNKEAVKQQLADEQVLYAQRLAEEKKLAEQEKALKNKMAQQEAKARKMELAGQLVMGIANTALGITQALKTYAPPLSIAMAAIVGTMGAIQTALIASQISKIKPVKYAEGGIIQGASHAQGGVPVGNTNIEVEGGEMIVNKKDTARYSDVLHRINRNDPSVRYLQGSTDVYVDTKIRKYADGGTLNFERADANLRANQSTERLMNAIDGINMQPVVSVRDIWKVEDRLVRVRGLAGR